jgi:hypothetical protein
VPDAYRIHSPGVRTGSSSGAPCIPLTYDQACGKNHQGQAPDGCGGTVDCWYPALSAQQLPEVQSVVSLDSLTRGDLDAVLEPIGSTPARRRMGCDILDVPECR